jgi:hypothetical protein
MTSSKRGKEKDKPRRGRPPAPETERKDRLIQTRVEEDLDEALRAEARKQRVTVSQLIRNVLHDTFHLVDDFVANTASLTEAVKRDARRIAASAQGFASEEEARVARAQAAAAKAQAQAAAAAEAASTTSAPAVAAEAAVAELPAFEAALAWQEVVMGRERACSRCGKPLPKGTKGFLGVMDDPSAPRPFICPECAAELGSS